MNKNIPKIVICPRCETQIEWEYEKLPSRGWICKYCRRELKIWDGNSISHPRPMNDMEERKLSEDWACDSGELYELEPEYQDLALEKIFEGGGTANNNEQQERELQCICHLKREGTSRFHLIMICC